MESLKKIFHTDKWWGRAFFVISLYIAYLILCYGVIPFLIIIVQGFNFGGVVFFSFVFLIAPILSFKIPTLIKKSFGVNSFFLYFFHILFIVLVPLALIWLFLSTLTFNIGGF